MAAMLSRVGWKTLLRARGENAVRQSFLKQAPCLSSQTKPEDRRETSGLPIRGDAARTRGGAQVSSAKFVRRRKLRTNEPFIKNLFLGKFDKSMLVFPEISSNEELEILKQMVEQVEKFFADVDSAKIDEEAKISKDVLQQLGELGLFGQQVPMEYGGLGLTATKYARLAEITALDGSIAVTLAAHQAIGLKGILLFGTEEQKRKYLPLLATGQQIAAFCLTEPSSGSDAASIQTRATLSEDGSKFYLSGSKIWISNGGIADIFTVFAKTEVLDNQGNKEDRITAFIVERGFGGVTSGKPEDKLGIRGSNTCEVSFDNTPVPVENVIDELGNGFKVAMKILNSGRFSMGSSASGVLKKILASAVEHGITRTQFGRKLVEFGLIKEKIAKVSLAIYAMESMAYHTAGIIDNYDDADVSLEAAIIKVFSSENSWSCVSECLQILGGLGYMKEYPYQRFLRDSRIMLIFEGTNEILRMYIALTGMQYAGRTLLDLIKKLRDPMNNPGLVFRSVFQRIQRNNLRNPRLTLDLEDAIHPTLKPEAQLLEKCCLQFQKVVEVILSRHGKKIVDEQMDLKRIADVTIDLYVMTACLARASRSYCIGLRNSDHEIMMAKTVCLEASRRTENLIFQLVEGKIDNNDENYRHIADMVTKNKGYAAEHPLTRNW